jgi:amino acid transporter
MNPAAKIPVWGAILINANIVIGSAFFLHAQKISSATGLIAPIAWLLCGLLLFPLVIILAHLARTYPTAGGIYVYSQKQLGQFWGFVSGWGYFIGTIAANAAVLHAFSLELQKLGLTQNFLATSGLDNLCIDIFLVLIFTLLNLLNIEFLERIQIGFTILKSIPLLLIIFSLPFLFKLENLTTAPIAWDGFVHTLPLVLFAYVGIEACCAIADKIQDGQRNASRVIFISFALIMSIYSILQFSLLCIHGTASIDPFSTILPMLTTNQAIIHWGNSVINLAILASFLAGFYGMFYFNNWNLYAMANDNSILFSKQLTKLNSQQVPWICVIVQSLLVMLFLLITSKTEYLSTMADLGTIVAYLLSALAFLTLKKSISGYCALGSCAILLFICSKSLFESGLYLLIPFITILGLGLAAHYANEMFKKRS